jgi:hypothetical protein
MVRWSWGRAQRVAAIALVVASASFTGLRCARSPEIVFLVQSEKAPWIALPLPVTAELMQWGRTRAPVASFTRSFAVEDSSRPVWLELRALREYQLSLDGLPIADSRDPRRWRERRRLELTPRLPAGAHELRVEVWNARGPALLSAQLGGGARFGSEGWQTAQEGRALGPAILADDTRRNPTSTGIETPLRTLGRRAWAAALLFGLGALASLAPRLLAVPRARAALAPFARLGAALPQAWLPRAALLLAALAWLWLLLAKLVRMPLALGFDARHHLAYAGRLLAGGGLPLASDGWSTFHPPLFYALAALTARAFGVAPPEGDLERWVDAGPAPALAFRLLPWASGLASVCLAGWLARRLFPRERALEALAILFVALLPVNLTVSAGFSNESLHAALSGAALVAAVACLLAPRTGLFRVSGLAALLALAALAKFTALLLVPIALCFVVCKLLAVERAPAGRLAAAVAIYGAAFAALAGWYYLRNWLALGDPLAANWSFSEPGRVWWQQPGFHTPAYYASFGEVLSHPYLGGFRSLWDSLYSTFWGDGFVAGRVSAGDRHPFWNYDFMSIGYLVALPASALVLAGALEGLALALRDPDPRRRAAFSFLLTLLYAVGFAFVSLSLQLPYYSQTKAAYLLLLAAPLAVFFARAFVRFDAALARRGQAAPRAFLHGWLALFAGTLFLTYWA